VSDARVDAVQGRASASALATFREGSLHAALKARYAAGIVDGRVETAVDGYIVDVVGRHELIEIQTSSFGSARRKLERLVATHRVVLVHPIPLETWLVRVDANGVIIRRRRSPKRGLALDLFEELVHLPGLIAKPNFRIELVLTTLEEVRGPVPAGARYRYARDWWRLDRRLLDVVETRRIDGPGDLLGLLPASLPTPFTTADVVAATGRSRRLAMRATYCLERSGAVERVARQGRYVAYRPVAPPGDATNGDAEAPAAIG
jgi:hypothetical protein